MTTEINNFNIPDLHVGQELEAQGEICCVGGCDSEIGTGWMSKMEINGVGAGSGGSLGQASDGVCVGINISGGTFSIESVGFWEADSTYNGILYPPLTMVEEGVYNASIETGLYNREFDFWEEVTDTATTSFEVKPPLEPDIFVESCDVSPNDVVLGDLVTVSITMSNRGDVEGTSTLTVMSGGETIDSDDYTIGKGESVNVEFDVEMTTAGQRDIEYELQ